MRATKIRRLDETYKRYDLSIKGTHNFVCEGVVVHNTSAHIKFQILQPLVDKETGEPVGEPQEKLTIFSGGEKYHNFCKVFATPEEIEEHERRYKAHIENLKTGGKQVDPNTLWDLESLKARFREFGDYSQFEGITIYGEAYGGRQQGMKDTYGPDLKFIAFEVLMGDNWLDVPKADKVATDLGFEFVHYVKCDTTLEALNVERDKDSTQAIRNGMGPGHKAEGVVVHPPIELCKNNGGRLIVKYKREDFSECKTPKGMGRDKLIILSQAREVANEWVTEMRLSHVLSKLEAEGHDTAAMETTGQVVRAMVDDVKVEGEGEIEWSNAVGKAIGSEAARMYKRRVSKI